MPSPISRRLAIPALVVLALTFPSLKGSAAVIRGVSGTVFRDIDADGRKSVPEPGVDSVTVTAFDAVGTPVATTQTSRGGLYNLDPEGAGPWRVEFSGWPTGYLTGSATGTADGTAVRTLWSGAQHEDLALVRPGEICQADPEVVVACFSTGHAAGANAGERSTARFRSSKVGGFRDEGWTPPAAATRFRETGAVYGVAWQPSSQSVFTSAYLRRFSGFGPGGIGAIYRNGKLALNLATLPGLKPFGTDPHAPAPTGEWTHDAPSWPLVGTVGLGDLDISLDGRSLYTVNLASRQLLQIPVHRDGAVPTPQRVAYDHPVASGEIGQFEIPAAVCPDPLTWRPFGLGLDGTRVLVGATCFANLHGYVLPFDPVTATWSAPLLDVDLGFPRGRNGFERMWEGWRDDETKTWNRPQLLVSDIVMDRGDLVIALRDRYGDQTGVDARTTVVGSSETYSTGVLGDVLRACRGAGGAFVLEDNGRCGGRATAGAGNADGPGGGEYYWQDDFLHNGKIGEDNPHSNASEGSLGLLPMENRIMSAHMDPVNYFTGGVVSYDNDSGVRTTSYEFAAKGAPGTFGKANGLGDLETLCSEGAIEIGNQVWLDADGDGIQDPNESGIGGVLVDLLGPDGSVLGTATTDATGRYLFTNGPGASTASRRRGMEMEPNLPGYRVRVVRAQPVLVGLDPTVTGSDGPAAGVGRDSDGKADATTSTTDVLTTPLPAVGVHTYDFGFTYIDVSRRNSPAAPPAPAPVATTTEPPKSQATPVAAAPPVTSANQVQLAFTGSSTWWFALAALVLLLAGLSLLETSESGVVVRRRE